MTPNSSALSSRAFATPDAGFDYFAVEAHCRSLAGRIAAALGGFSVVVVSGDPPLSARLLSTALSEAAQSRHLTVPLLYSPKPGRHDVLDFRRALSASLASGRDTGEEAASTTRAPPLVILENADRLSDEQIEEVFKGIHDHRIGAAVVLARPEFLARLERPVLRFWLAKRLLVARLRFQELGADEVPAFIRHQLRPGEGEGVFTNEAMTAIANVSGGDPLVVNRFSRRLLDLAAATTGARLTQAVVTGAAVAQTGTASEERRVPILDEPARQPAETRELGALPRTRMWRRGGAALKLSAGTMICLAFGVVGALLVRPAGEKIAAPSMSANEAAVAVPEGGASTGEAVLSGVATSAAPTPARTPEEPAESPAEPAPAAVSPAAAREDAASYTAPAIAAAPDGITTPVAGASPGGTVPTAAAASTSIPETSSTISAPVPTTPGAPPRLSAAEIAALVARGDSMFALGDIASARLFYERAADAGEGQAALKLAKAFDPVLLYLAHFYGVRGDTDMAAYWYHRAHDLAEGEAR